MPELPEVENIARQLRQNLPGLEFSSLVIRFPAILKHGKKEDVQKFFGKKIESVERRGKFLILRAESGLALIVHLGMTGQLLWQEDPDSAGKHVHAVFGFKGKSEKLAYRDIRRFGGLAVANGTLAGWPEGLRLMGPEPFEVEEADFLKRFSHKEARIKSLLLNQRLLAGLGNIYADESLFRAGIDPRRRGKAVKKDRFPALLAAIREVLNEAIEAGGSSIDDYIHINGKRGGFQKKHRVYARAGKKCFKCGTLIKRAVLGGRSSFFCPACQK